MRLFQQTLEAAAAAALATSFFAFPIGLVALHPDPALSAPPEAPVRLATFVPSVPAPAASEASQPSEASRASEDRSRPVADPDAPAAAPASTTTGSSGSRAGHAAVATMRVPS